MWSSTKSFQYLRSSSTSSRWYQADYNYQNIEKKTYFYACTHPTQSLGLRLDVKYILMLLLNFVRLRNP